VQKGGPQYAGDIFEGSEEPDENGLTHSEFSILMQKTKDPDLYANERGWCLSGLEVRDETMDELLMPFAAAPLRHMPHSYGLLKR
jgi:hypothetical protein